MLYKHFRLLELKWGWHNDDFIGVHERLYEYVPCYSNMTARHSDVTNAIQLASYGEERRARNLHQLLDKVGRSPP